MAFPNITDFPAGNSSSNEGPPSISDPARSATSHLGSPGDLIAAIVGSGSIRLHGFSAPPAMPTWLRPGMQFVSAGISVQKLDAVFLARQRRQRWVRNTTVVASHIAAIAATFWLSQEFIVRNAAPALLPVAWTVAGVNESAVSVRFSGITEPVTIEIPVGGRLPNGERIQSTVPGRNAYITESGTTILRGGSSQREEAP